MAKRSKASKKTSKMAVSVEEEKFNFYMNKSIKLAYDAVNNGGLDVENAAELFNVDYDCLLQIVKGKNQYIKNISSLSIKQQEQYLRKYYNEIPGSDYIICKKCNYQLFRKPSCHNIRAHLQNKHSDEWTTLMETVVDTRQLYDESEPIKQKLDDKTNKEVTCDYIISLENVNFKLNDKNEKNSPLTVDDCEIVSIIEESDNYLPEEPNFKDKARKKSQNKSSSSSRAKKASSKPIVTSTTTIPRTIKRSRKRKTPDPTTTIPCRRKKSDTSTIKFSTPAIVSSTILESPLTMASTTIASPTTVLKYPLVMMSRLVTIPCTTRKTFDNTISGSRTTAIVSPTTVSKSPIIIASPTTMPRTITIPRTRNTSNTTISGSYTAAMVSESPTSTTMSNSFPTTENSSSTTSEVSTPARTLPAIRVLSPAAISAAALRKASAETIITSSITTVVTPGTTAISSIARLLSSPTTTNSVTTMSEPSSMSSSPVRFAAVTHNSNAVPHTLLNGKKTVYNTPHPISFLTTNDDHENDEFAQFGKYLVSQLRQLPLKKALTLQQKFQCMLLKERMDMLETD